MLLKNRSFTRKAFALLVVLSVLLSNLGALNIQAAQARGKAPGATPTPAITAQPTDTPTGLPAPESTATTQPTDIPTLAPTGTVQPTDIPTLEPTQPAAPAGAPEGMRQSYPFNPNGQYRPGAATEQTFLPGKFPSGPRAFKGGPQSALNPNPLSLALGAVGLSYSYAQTFGVSEIPYFSDTAHINYPWGIATSGTNVLIGEELGRRILKYTNAGVYVSSIGTAGTSYNKGEAWEVYSMAVDSSGQTWITAGGNRSVYIFDSSNKYVKEFQNGTFSNPAGIAFDASGNVYISDGGAWWSDDIGNQRVLIYNSSGTLLSQIGTTGVSGSDNAHFHGPQHIAIYGTSLYVADSGNARVQIFTISNPSAPVYAATIGVTGVTGNNNSHFDHPSGVAVNSGHIYVADRWNDRVQVFARNNRAYQATLGTGWGTANNQFESPSDVAVDTSSNIFVADFYNARVQEFNSSYVYQRTYGTTGVPYLTDNNHYNFPNGVAIAADGSMYVSEENGQRLIKRNADGSVAWAIGEAGARFPNWPTDNAHWQNPADIALNAAGQIYVADQYDARVQIFNPNGTYAATLGGGSGSDDSYVFSNPAGLKIDKNGYIYVTDSDRQRVQIYNSSLNYVASLGVTDTSGSDNAHFNSPTGVAVDSNGNIYVADSDNYRVQVFNSSRVYVRTMGVTGTSGYDYTNFGHPERLAVDASDRLYVSDTWNNCVDVFDPNGAYLTTIGGRWGSQPGSLRSPKGLAFDQSGALYVADWQNHRIQKYTLGTPNWSQTNLNGFGQRYNRISAMASFNSQIYAGTYNFGGNGAQLWRSSDGASWSAVMSNGFGDTFNVGIDHLLEFNGKLYAGTWNQNNDGSITHGGQVWRSGDGSSWEQVASGGFGDFTNGEVFHLAVFNNQIYASTWSYTNTHGAEIWRSSTGNSGDWTRVASNGFGKANAQGIVTMVTFNGYLYAGTYDWNYSTNLADGCEIWRSATGSSGDWTQVAGGFGDANCFQVASLSEFNGALYASTGTWNNTLGNSTGGQIWHCTQASGCDAASDWTQVISNGFGNPINQDINTLKVYNGKLYATTRNTMTGMEIWMSSDGAAWQQTGFAGFGDSNNYDGYYDNADIVFNGHYFVGTANFANGGEIWSTTSANTPGADVAIGSVDQGRINLPANTFGTKTVPDLVTGPVDITSSDGNPIFASQRATSGESYNEVMGVPTSQLNTDYWFPAYDHSYIKNVNTNPMRMWVLIGNASTTQTANVNVFIGGVLTTDSPFSIPPGGRITPRWIGTKNGPVEVVSTNGVNIFTSERVFTYPSNSFNEILGFPANQLTSEYWFPYYDSVSMTNSIQVSNTSSSLDASVDIYVGTTKEGTYSVPANGTITQSYPSLVDGPVRVVSTNGVSVVASQITLSGPNNAFNEVLGYPYNQFTTEYWYPAYDHAFIKNVNTDLMRMWVLVGNPDPALAATVDIYIAGVKTADSPFSIPPGGRVTPRWMGVTDGPVRVVSTNGVPIFTSERVFTYPSSVFNEMMGFPLNQMSTEYWFPYYDSINMSNDILVSRP